MTSPHTPLSTRRLRAGIAGLGLVLGLALAGCSSPAADDAATPAPSASADAASPAPEATTEGDAGSGDAAATETQATLAAKTKDIACSYADKTTLEEADVQAFRDLAAEITSSSIDGSQAAGEQISSLADQLAPSVGQPVPDELKTTMTSTCQQLQ